MIGSCYISLNLPIRQFNAYLDELYMVAIKYVGIPLLILGDFNARHKDWDPRSTTTRGRLRLDA